MCTSWHICKTLSTYEKLHVQKFYYKLLFFKKLIIQGSIEIVTYRRLKYRVFVFPGPWPWPPAPICFLAAQVPICIQRPSSQICIYQLRSSICICQSPALNLHLLALANQNTDNKSQRLHIMLLYLFLLSNSFVTVIGCCSLLLLYLRLLFISIGYLCFPTSGPRSGPRSSISIYWSRPSVFVCLFFAAKVCYSYRVYLHKLSVYIQLGSHLGFNRIKILKEISLALLTQVET